MLPYPFKIVGLLLALSGILLAILYIWFDFRLSMPVFAVYSAFIETKFFVIFNTNFADELVLLLLVGGLGLIIFSKEKSESEQLDAIRFHALYKALAFNTVFLFISVLFVYGSGFIAVLILNTVSFSFFYLCFFYIPKHRLRNK